MKRFLFLRYYLMQNNFFSEAFFFFSFSLFFRKYKHNFHIHLHVSYDYVYLSNLVDPCIPFKLGRCQYRNTLVLIGTVCASFHVTVGPLYRSCVSSFFACINFCQKSFYRFISFILFDSDFF